MASTASGSSKTVNGKFHLSVEGMLPKKRKLTSVASQSHKGKPTKSSKKVSDDQLSWDKMFEDSYLADFEMVSDSDLVNGIEIENEKENPFVFGNCCLALVEPRKSTLHTNCLENLLYNLGLDHSKQLSILSKTDFYSTNITPDSTRNTPKDLDTQMNVTFMLMMCMPYQKVVYM